MNGIAKNRNSICHAGGVSIRMPEGHMGGIKVSFNCKKRTLCNDIDSMIRSYCLFLRVF